MDVLLVSPELAPVVKVGGLADAVAALAKTLRALGHNVTVVMPRYKAVEKSGLMLARRLSPLTLEAGDEQFDAMLFDARLPSGVELTLIDIPGLYDRDGVYGDGDTAHPDNARRFGLFSRAVVQMIQVRAAEGRGFDVVHAHDWPTALVPFLLRDKQIRCLLTVHNASHQGRFGRDAIEQMGLSADDFHPSGLEFFGDTNLLKGGVLTADVVTTVSPQYAREICTSEYGEGLDAVFRGRGSELVGILNGVDYATWSPATDPHLVARFDAEAVGNKGRGKAKLLRKLGFPLEPDRPLFVSLGRIDKQKGTDILCEAIPGIIDAGAQVVVAGSGDKALVRHLEKVTGNLAGEAVYVGHVDEPNAHRLIGAADGVLMPSRFEPCGLVQQYGQRYGAAPIVSAVGGLVDTVVDCDSYGETGTGFVFEDLTAEGLVAASQRAVALMQSPRWGAVRRRLMRQDLSWERAARRYARLYQKAPSLAAE